jgi:glycine/D-amino acid oxidase-like deaminating enzyme
MNGQATYRLQKAAALLLAALSMACPVRATTLARMSLDQLAQAAGAVVRARCASTSSRWENGAIWTFSEFEIVERFKGSTPTHIRVRLPGGRVGHISTRVEEAPEFRPGDDAVLFLEASGDGSYGVTAWAEGTFRIRRSSESGPELVTQDSSGVAVFDPVTRQFRSEGIHHLLWSEFRRRLVDALPQPNARGLR